MVHFFKRFLFFILFFQTITSFVLMDFNGPLFIIENRHAYNATDIITILKWDKQTPDPILLGFVVNLPILLVLNLLVLKLSYWVKGRVARINDYFASIISVILVYLSCILFWWFALGNAGSEKFFFHPLAVLIGVGFFISNLIFFSLWYLIGYLKEMIMSKS